METRDILTVDEAARYLRIKKSTLQQKVRRHEIPFTPLSEKTVVFVKRFLDIWLALVTQGDSSAKIRALEISLYSRKIIPGNLLPLADDAYRQIDASDADKAAGRVIKIED